MSSNPVDSGIDNTLTSRYECKYLINEKTAAGIRRYLSTHASLDPFSARREDHRYRVISLYLDSQGLRLYQDTAQGLRNRFKLRLRYYDETGDGPVFMEVKKRSDVIVRKSRELVSRDRANNFLLTGNFDLEDRHGEDLREFLQRCRDADAWPALRLRYWREAWESRGVDPVRITFDTEVEHCCLSDRGLSESHPDWVVTPLSPKVILEVKFTDLRPHWLNLMLHMFQLDKISVAKYAESIEHIEACGGRRALEASMSLAQWHRSERSAN